jgi:hypothetical protein
MKASGRARDPRHVRMSKQWETVESSRHPSSGRAQERRRPGHIQVVGELKSDGVLVVCGHLGRGLYVVCLGLGRSSSFGFREIGRCNLADFELSQLKSDIVIHLLLNEIRV